MAPASPLGVGGGVGLSRREAVHRFTRVLRAATGDPGRPPCGAREHAADDQDRGSPTDRLESPHHDRCREPAEREPHRLYRQRSGSPFLEPRDGRRRDGEEADQAHADCQQQHREEELGTTIDHGDRDEAGSAHDRAGTHHRAHTPSLDLSPLHRPDEGGLRAWPRRRRRGRSSTSRTDLGVPRRDFRILGPTPSTGATTRRSWRQPPSILCTDAESWCRWWVPPSGDRALVIVETQKPSSSFLEVSCPQCGARHTRSAGSSGISWSESRDRPTNWLDRASES